MRNLFSCHRDRTGGHRKKSCDRIRNFRLTVSGDTCNGKNLSFVNREGYVLHHIKFVLVLHGEIFHRQDLFSEAGRRLLQLQLHLMSDHEACHLTRIHICNITHGDELSAAQNRTAIRHLFDLIQLVCDQNDGLPAIPKILNDFQQGIDFLRSQHCSRLVKNQDLRLAIQHLQNLYALSRRYIQIADNLRGIHLQAVLLRQLGNLPVGLLHIHIRKQAECLLLRLHTKNNVLRNRIIADKLEMLMNHTDVQLGCIPRRNNLLLLSAHNNLTLIRLVHAEQNAHQRGFARTVFTQKCKNLSFSDLQGDIIVRDNAGKAFGDVIHLNNVR